MEVANERSRNGESLGNTHAKARCLFSWTDTSMLRDRRRGSRLKTLAMNSSRANRTLFSMKSSERLLRSMHRDAGAFARDNKSRTARRAGWLPMLRYRMRSAMGLRTLLTRSSEWRSGARIGRSVCGRWVPKGGPSAWRVCSWPWSLSLQSFGFAV